MLICLSHFFFTEYMIIEKIMHMIVVLSLWYHKFFYLNFSITITIPQIFMASNKFRRSHVYIPTHPPSLIDHIKLYSSSANFENEPSGTEKFSNDNPIILGSQRLFLAINCLLK